MMSPSFPNTSYSTVIAMNGAFEITLVNLGST